MTSYILTLHGLPWSHQSIATAIDFAKVAIKNGKQIKAFFLYQDAVLNALPNLDIPSDELNGQQLLVDFQKEHDIPLLLCVTAAEKRGISLNHVAEGFTIAGLAEFAELTSHTDKVVQFK